MKLSLIPALLVCCLINYKVFGQTCTYNADGGGTNSYSASTAGNWVSTGGATCPPTSTFTGTVVVNVGGNDTFTWDYPLVMNGTFDINMANDCRFIFNADVSVTGNMPVTNTGTNAVLEIKSGADVAVYKTSPGSTTTGNMGDPTNNNVQMIVDGTLFVENTLSGKNSNAISGSGSIDGGTLVLGTGATCSTPCPLAGGFTTCTVNTPNFCTTYSVTPIVLSYFNVSIPENSNRTLIEWATSSEENFSHFEIQRAGKDLRWNTILEVQGAGYNTNSLKEYTVYDENPLIGVGYYRLKAVDIDGSYEYFKVKSVNHGGGRRLLVSPNPTTGSRFSYSINWDPGLYDRISLIDAIGNEVYSAPVTTLQNDLQINKTLRPGAYLLRYTGSSFQEVTRVFIKD